MQLDDCSETKGNKALQKLSELEPAVIAKHATAVASKLSNARQ